MKNEEYNSLLIVEGVEEVEGVENGRKWLFHSSFFILHSSFNLIFHSLSILLKNRSIHFFNQRNRNGFYSQRFLFVFSVVLADDNLFKT